MVFPAPNGVRLCYPRPPASSALPASVYAPGKLEDPSGALARRWQGRGRRLAGASQGR